MSQTPPDSPPSPTQWYGNKPIYLCGNYSNTDEIANIVINANLHQIYDDFDNDILLDLPGK